jgi:hypothetical protein
MEVEERVGTRSSSVLAKDAAKMGLPRILVLFRGPTDDGHPTLRVENRYAQDDALGKLSKLRLRGCDCLTVRSAV